MIAIRKEESDVVDDDEKSNKDTIVQGIFKKELLKIFPKFSEKNPENGNEFLFIRGVMPTLHVHSAVSGTVRRTTWAIQVLGKSQTAHRTARQTSGI